MELEPQPLYSIILILASTIALFIAAVAWPRRAAPGARPLIAYSIAVILWTVPYAVHWMITAASARFFWLDLTYLGAATISVTYLAFALEYTGRSHWLTSRRLTALSIIPALTLVALFTDEAHGLFYGGQRTAGLIFSGGPMFWLNVIYGYCLTIFALVLSVTAFRHSPLLQRRQMGLVLIGTLVPFFINAIMFTSLSPFKDLDLTPLGFTVTGVFFAAALLRYGLFELVPVARGVLIEHLPDGMLVLDQQQRIIDLNPAASRLLDRDAGQLIGRTLPQAIDHWPGGAPDRAASPIELTLTAGRVAEARLSPLIDRSGQRQGDVILLRDITDRKRAEAALQQLNASLETQVQARTAELRAEKDKSDTILHSVGEALLLTDLEFHIQYVNEAFTTLTGYLADESLRQPIGTRAAWPEAADLLAAVRGGQTWRGEVTGRRKDNWPYEAALTVAPVRDGHAQLIGCVISYQDITQRKSLERARARFIESISHEFRTPLTSLGLYTELLQANKRPEKNAQYLNQITNQLKRLQRLIEDSLEMATLDMQRETFEQQSLSLAALAQTVSQRAAETARAKGLELTLDLDSQVRVWGDEARLTQALWKVIDNAVTFTPPGGRITLATRGDVSSAATHGVIDVSDTGPGLTVEELPRIFDRFYRGKEAEPGHIPGSGLGLSIAQAIVHAHGGEITVQSEVGRGSTFSLRLPAAR